MKRIIILVLVGIMTCMASIFANDGAFYYNPQTSELYPMENDAIQMISEIVIYSNKQFRTVFYFSNTTDVEQKVTMGFPIIKYNEEPSVRKGGSLRREDRSRGGLDVVKKQFDFQTSVNGKTVERKIKDAQKQDDFDYVFYFDAMFKPNELVCISNQYNQFPVHGSSGMLGYFTNHLYYYLKTGASWKNNLMKSDIYVYVPKITKWIWGDVHPKFTHAYYYSYSMSEFYMKTFPRTTKYSENKKYFILHWSYKDFKPRKNIQVVWGYYPMAEGKKFREQLEYLTIAIEKNQLHQIENEYFKFSKFMQKMQDFEYFCSFIYSVGTFPRNYINAYQFIINSIYALNGYKFKDRRWNRFYRKFKWYKPTTDKPEFSKREREMIDKLLKNQKKAIEMRRKHSKILEDLIIAIENNQVELIKKENYIMNTMRGYYKHSFIHSLGWFFIDYEKYEDINKYQFVINSLYAFKGYKFKDKKWTKFYSKFKWYKPTTDKPKFSKQDREMIDKLLKMEKRMKRQHLKMLKGLSKVKLNDKVYFRDFVYSLGKSFTYDEKYKDIKKYRFVINSLYALNGYKFKERRWTKLYSKFTWYKPTTDKPDFSKQDRELIDTLQNIEKRLKRQRRGK